VRFEARASRQLSDHLVVGPGLFLLVSAPWGGRVTFWLMSRPLRNRIDSCLEYHPRDYLDNPTRFGTSERIKACIPLGGDGRSLKIAWAQHQLAAKYNAITPEDKMGTSEITKEYEFSEATWSRTLTGQRWAGLTAIVALLEATGVWMQHNPQSTTPAKTFNSRNQPGLKFTPNR
jgi:hypothetical protein